MFWNNRSRREDKQTFSANRLRRHKSFSCPHLLISDLSVPPHESKFKIKSEYHSQVNLLQENNVTQVQTQCDKKPDAGEAIECLPHYSISPSIKSNNRRLSVSLPKEIDTLTSMVGGRKMGTIAKPCQTEMFVERNVNELCPMMEKYRQ